MGFESWSPAIEANYHKRAHCDVVPDCRDRSRIHMGYIFRRFDNSIHLSVMHRMLVVRMRFLTEFT